MAKEIWKSIILERLWGIWAEIGELVSVTSSEWVLIDTRKQSISKITEEMVEEYGLVEKSVFEKEPAR